MLIEINIIIIKELAKFSYSEIIKLWGLPHNWVKYGILIYAIKIYWSIHIFELQI